MIKHCFDPQKFENKTRKILLFGQYLLKLVAEKGQKGKKIKK
jgi:hypothetical protein